MKDLHQYFQLYQNETLVEWGVNRFPDGQIQFKTNNLVKKKVDMICSIVDSECLDLFLQILHTLQVDICQINYLYGARSDKDYSGKELVCNVPAMLFDLASHTPNTHEWIRFRTEYTILTPHCDELVHRYFSSAKHSPPKVIQPIHQNILSNIPEYGLVVFPDESAERRFGHILPGVDKITCVKERDQETGRIIRHYIPNMSSATKILLIDDLLDGGRSFIDIRDQNLEFGQRMDLCVTHAIWSSDEILERILTGFSKIWVTNSLPNSRDRGLSKLENVNILDVWRFL